MTRILRPSSFREACEMLANESPGARLIAGGTDLLVRARQAWLPEILVDLSSISRNEGREIQRDGDQLRVGALVTFAQLCESPLIAECLPALHQAASAMGSVQIRTRGTLGGNMANASPAGDSIPSLLVADARVELLSVAGARWLPVDQLFLGPGATAIEPAELIQSVEWRVVQGFESAFTRIGARTHHFISKASVAVGARPDSRGALHDLRVGLGSLAPTPTRAHRVEALLEGVPWRDAPWQALLSALHQDICPIDDLRSTAEYRSRVAAELLARLLCRLSGT